MRDPEVETNSQRIARLADGLRLGQWTAWAVVAMYAVYLAAVALSGVLTGTAPKDPFWMVAEVVTLIAAPIQVILFALLYQYAPDRAKLYGLLAFGFIVVWAALTMSVHYIELTLVRRVDLAASRALTSIFDLAHPSLLLAIELLAWHLFFGLSQVSAAFTFTGRGKERFVRIGLTVGGLLSIVGLSGLILDKPALRILGVIGYGLVFPIVCFVIGLVFRTARHQIRETVTTGVRIRPTPASG